MGKSNYTEAAHRGGYYFACHITPTKKGNQ
nr:MAG TPA: hypothetical protein [Caudoviricetes sp.]